MPPFMKALLHKAFRSGARALGASDRQIDWWVFSRLGWRARGVRFLDFDQVLRDYAAFSGEPLASVTERVRTATEVSAAEWRRLPGETFREKIDYFYAKTPYVYAAMNAYLMWREYKKKETCLRILEFVRRFGGRDVLEFGGGVGQLCLILAGNTDKRVVNMDLPSQVMDFATWRFRRHGVSVASLPARVSDWPIPEESFDCVVSDAVLEHIERIEEALAAIGRGVRPGGYLYLVIDRTQGPDFPMHVSAGFDPNVVFAPMGIDPVGSHMWRKRP